MALVMLVVFLLFLVRFSFNSISYLSSFEFFFSQTFDYLSSVQALRRHITSPVSRILKNIRYMFASLLCNTSGLLLERSALQGLGRGLYEF